MNAIRLFAAALVAVTGLVLSAPDANAHGREGRPAKYKKWKKHARYDRQPQYRVVYKWVWNSYYRNWEWKAVYEPVRFEYDDHGRGHDHPFPEHDGHEHGDDGSCRF